MANTHRWALALLLAWLGIPAAHADALEDIKTSRVLRVCIWPDYYGISYRNPRTGHFHGLDIELSQALASDLDVHLSYVETDFSRLIGDLVARKCHIAMMGVGVTPARAERLAFSQPYLRSDIHAVTTRGNQALKTWEDLDQKGRVIAVQKGTYMAPLMRQRLKQATLLVVDRPGEREHDVESGRADAFITDYPYSQRMLMNTDWARIISPSQTIQLTDYAYAVAKGETRWLARINQFVSQIKQDGRLKDAARPHRLTPILVLD